MQLRSMYSGEPLSREAPSMNAKARVSGRKIIEATSIEVASPEAKWIHVASLCVPAAIWFYVSAHIALNTCEPISRTDIPGAAEIPCDTQSISRARLVSHSEQAQPYPRL